MWKTIFTHINNIKKLWFKGKFFTPKYIFFRNQITSLVWFPFSLQILNIIYFSNIEANKPPPTQHCPCPRGHEIYKFSGGSLDLHLNLYAEFTCLYPLSTTCIGSLLQNEAEYVWWIYVMQERCQKAIWGPIAISNSPSSLRWTKNWTITKEKYEFKKHLNARVKIIYSNTYNTMYTVSEP